MISHSMSRLTLLALLVAGLVVWVPACGQEGNDAYKAIQGNWQPTEWTSDGEPRFKDDLKDRRLIFTGQEVRLVLRGFGEEDGQAKGFPIRLDPTKKPAHIDMTLPPGKGGKNGIVMVGIYELERDTLKLCFADWPNDRRPTEFSAKAGSRHALIVLKRLSP